MPQRDLHRHKKRAWARASLARDLWRYAPDQIRQAFTQAEGDLPPGQAPTLPALRRALQDLVSTLGSPGELPPGPVKDELGIGVGGALQVLESLAVSNPGLAAILDRLRQSAPADGDLSVKNAASPLRVAITNIRDRVDLAADKFSIPRPSGGPGPTPAPDDLRILTPSRVSVESRQYSLLLQGAGGIRPYRWSLPDGHDWITVDPEGTLSALVSPGEHVVTVQLTDATPGGVPITQALTLCYGAAGARPSLHLPGRKTMAVPGNRKVRVQLPVETYNIEAGATWWAREPGNAASQQTLSAQKLEDGSYAVVLDFSKLTVPAGGQVLIGVTNPGGASAHDRLSFEGYAAAARPPSHPGPADFDQAFEALLSDIEKLVRDRNVMSATTAEAQEIVERRTVAHRETIKGLLTSETHVDVDETMTRIVKTFADPQRRADRQLKQNLRQQVEDLRERVKPRMSRNSQTSET